jgi:predicted lipid-binding transport protein (Tim44 family)
MGMEERLLLRLAIRVVLLALLVVAAVAGQSYGLGTRPLWFAVAVGVLVVLLTYARLMSRRSGARPPGAVVSETAKRGGRRVKLLVQRVVAAVRGARRRGRVRRVELAAHEAAEDEDALAPDSVRTAAESLFRLVQLARDARDPGRLATLFGPELLAEWERRLTDVERSGLDERLEVIGDVRVEYVGFTTRERGEGPLAVVLIEADLRTYEDHRGGQTEGETRRLCEYWTLGLRDGLWAVLTIEDRAEGKHHLGEPIGAPSAAPR